MADLRDLLALRGQQIQSAPLASADEMSAHSPWSPELPLYLHPSPEFDLLRPDWQVRTPPTLQTATPESFGHRVLQSLFTTAFPEYDVNAKLPPAKTWVDPDFGLPPPPTMTTKDLATLGGLALGGMGAAMPAVARAVPSLISPLGYAQALPLALNVARAHTIFGPGGGYREVPSARADYASGHPPTFFKRLLDYLGH